MQIQCKIDEPLKIPLHSNIRWGSAHGMLERSYHLRQVSHASHFQRYLLRSTFLKSINLFLASADGLFGPITTVRMNGRITKKIPWSAFQLSDEDWERVKDVKDILVVCHLLSLRRMAVPTRHARILRKYSTIFLLNDFQHSGVPSLHLKTCNLHGRQNATTFALPNTRMRSTMA